MTRTDMANMFSTILEGDDFLRFERVESPMHPRPDICAFLMLDERQARPGCDIVSFANYDEIALAIDVDALAAVADEAFIRDLVRCGVRYDEEHDDLRMYV